MITNQRVEINYYSTNGLGENADNSGGEKSSQLHFVQVALKLQIIRKLYLLKYNDLERETVDLNYIIEYIDISQMLQYFFKYI